MREKTSPSGSMNRAQRRKVEKAIRCLVTDRRSHHSTEETAVELECGATRILPLTTGVQLKNSPSRAACSPIVESKECCATECRRV